MYQHIILPEAYHEFFKAWEWYEEIQDGLGNRFRDKVFGTINRIIENPFHYAERTPRFREALIDVFPYLIVYEVFPDKRKVVIISIFHCKRNPILKYKKGQK